MSKISRRAFLKGAAAGAASVAAAGLLGGCASETECPEVEQVTCPEPTVTTSCTPSFFTAPDPIDPASCKETVETEVVIVGAGIAGVSAAASCADNDISCVVLEKLNECSSRGGGIGLCNTRYVKSVGLELDKEELIAAQHRWIRTCGSRVNEKLVNLWFNKSGEAGDWLLDKCDKYKIKVGGYRGYAPKAIIPESFDYHTFAVTDETPDLGEKSGALVAAKVLYHDSVESFHTHPATYYFNTRGEQLVKEGNKVVGVIATNENGDHVYYKASKGVVLATGDMHEDQEMVDYYCDENIKHITDCQNTHIGSCTGDGHKMGLWAGAVMQRGPMPLALHPQAGSWFHGAFMFLNKNGDRFCNEGTWVQGKSMNVMQQPGDYAYSIFDADYAEQNCKTLENGVGGGMFWDTLFSDITSPFVADDFKMWTEQFEINDEDHPNGTGMTVKADTLEELAEKTGIPYDKLQASVDRYNELVANGYDDDFHKQSEFLFPIKKAPFYAAKVAVSLLAIVGGLRIDTNMQCIDKDGNPIDGLYATGNTSGDMYQIDYPINMAGNSHGRCVTWGYLLGKHFAEI